MIWLDLLNMVIIGFIGCGISWQTGLGLVGGYAFIRFWIFGVCWRWEQKYGRGR